MLALYVFSLIVGGAFLAVSLLGDFLHGDAAGVDVHSLDLDLHGVDVDIHGGGLDLHGGLQADAEATGAIHGEHAATKILSLRTIVYSLFGFGAVGTVLSTLGGGSGSSLTLAFSLAGGGLTGFLITSVFNYLRRSESGGHAAEVDFVGLTGAVRLPLSGSQPGQILVQRGHRQYVLRALPHRVESDRTDPSEWSTVVIVDMERGIARVAPVEDDLGLKL